MLQRLAILAVLGLFVSPLTSPADDPSKDADLQWARGVADDFLQAIRSGDKADIESLLSPAYAKLLQERSRFSVITAAEAIREKVPEFAKPTITDSTISPDRDEAKFQGVLEYEMGTRAVTIRVVKEKESGRWRVSLVLVEEEKPRGKSAPK